MQVSCSIIHGVKRALYPKGYSKNWQLDLKNFLHNKGVEIAEPFCWSGSIWDPFSTKVIREYAEHLLEIQEKSDQIGVTRVNIIAKSMGAILAKNSIDLIKKEKKMINIDMLLRIATPDNSWCIENQTAKTIINVSSPSDDLYRYSQPFIYPIVKMLYPNKRILSHDVKNISLDGLSHSDFNTDRQIIHKDKYFGSLFNFYYLLLYNRRFLTEMSEY